MALGFGARSGGAGFESEGAADGPRLSWVVTRWQIERAESWLQLRVQQWTFLDVVNLQPPSPSGCPYYLATSCALLSMVKNSFTSSFVTTASFSSSGFTLLLSPPRLSFPPVSHFYSQLRRHPRAFAFLDPLPQSFCQFSTIGMQELEIIERREKEEEEGEGRKQREGRGRKKNREKEHESMQVYCREKGEGTQKKKTKYN